jgi:hypothetical protein
MATKNSARPCAVAAFIASNVVALRQRITPRQTALLARWLQAGERMGLSDAHAVCRDASERRPDHVLVWVRENPNPAYMVEPQGMGWVVTDLLHQRVLARLPGFAGALNFIRPVLSVDVAA